MTPPQSSSPVRVLWLIKGLGPGGAERLLCSMAELRDRRSFTYQVAYVLAWKDMLVGDLECLGVPTHCLDGATPWDLRWVRRLRRLLIEHPVDVAHLHSPYVAALARVVVRSLPRSHRPRLISTEHNVWWGYSRLTRLMNALTYRLDDVHLAVSDEVRHSVSRRWQDQVEVVVHGVLLDRLRSRPRSQPQPQFPSPPESLPALDGATGIRQRVRRELGLADDEVVAVTVANLRAQKAYPDLLAAARTVFDRGVRVRFLAIGQGPLADELQALHRSLALGEAFQFLGYRPDVAEVLAASDLFVLASTHEGLPVSVMEALAVGVPVIATRVGGVPEVVVDGVEGRLVPPSRPDLMAAVIEELARSPQLRARMAQAAFKAGDQFGMEHAVARIESIYRQLAGRAD